MQSAKPYIVKGSKTKESRSLSASKNKSVEREAEIERVNRLRDADCSTHFVGSGEHVSTLQGATLLRCQ